MALSFSQSSNASFSTRFNDGGSDTLIKLTQLLNADCFMCLSDSDNVTDSSLRQERNVSYSICVIPSGIFIEVNPQQPKNAAAPMVSSSSDNVMEVKL